MATNEIIEKLVSFIDTHLPFKEECEVVYLMAEIRKLIESESKQQIYNTLWFYCNWVLHPQNNKQPKNIRDIMERIDSSVVKNETELAIDKNEHLNFIGLDELGREMVGLFKDHGVSVRLVSDQNNWYAFFHQLCQILTYQPIVKPTSKIDSFYIEMKKGRAVIWIIEFNDERGKIGFNNG
ncbi:MAG TPA: hypothetical protein P5096_00790 [Patescibacteria group bacterium]|nr:hypothetical protein [Patescibacteria group bacterium]